MKTRPTASSRPGRIVAGENYLRLRSGCVLVRGARNGAIYDLKGQELYRLDQRMALALEMGGRGSPVREILRRLERDGHGLPVLEEALSLLEGLPVVEVHSTRPQTTAVDPRVSREPSLDFIWLELTEACSLRCVHCYAEAGEVPRPDELTLQEWTRILEQGALLGCRRVQFTGGDPLTHPGLIPLIRRARGFGYTFIEVFTNAALLTEDLMDVLEENGVAVAVSLYSHDPAVHDGVTGRRGSWKRTSRSIRSLVARGIPTRIAVVVMRSNEEGVEETLDYARSLGVRDVGIDTIRPTGRGSERDLLPTRWANEMTSPRFRLTGCGEGLSFNSCWSGKIAVESRGRVIPCIFSRDKEMGDLRLQGLEEVVKGPGTRFFWGFTLDHVETCRDCEFRFACRDCRAIAHTTRGGMDRKSPRCTYDPYRGIWGEGSARQVEELFLRSGATGTGEEEPMTPARKGADKSPSRPTRLKGVLHREVDGEVVLFDPVTNGIHGLNPTASFVWDLCDGSMTAAEIADELGSIYPDEGGITRDVEETLDRFRSLGLLEG